MCDRMNRETGKCFELGCRYHMVADRVNRNWNADRIASLIASVRHTCFFEIDITFPFSLQAIGATLRMTEQRVGQIEAKALTRMKLRARHLQVYLTEDPDIRYQRPGGMNTPHPSRWPLMLGATTAKNFAINARMVEQCEY